MFQQKKSYNKISQNNVSKKKIFHTTNARWGILDYAANWC